MRNRLLTLILCLLPQIAHGQSLRGDWNGSLAMPGGGQVRLLARFAGADDALRVRLVSVDLGAIVTEGTGMLADGRLVLSLPVIGGGYDGMLAADRKSITGTWRQNGREAPLAFVPGAITALNLHQPEPGDMTIRAPGGALAGTILKKGPIGAVIITGAGPANRDGNSPVNGSPDTYRQIAEGLAAHDISSLRFDKRGVGASAAALAREEDLRFATRADDARRFAAALKQDLKGRCVWLVGHSEGGQIAIAAAQNNPAICGLVLVATPGHSYLASTRDYFVRNLPAAQQPAAFAALDALGKNETPANVPPMLAPLFRPASLPYQRSKADWDTAAYLAKLKIPVLILQGEADMNVAVTDARALAEARPDAALHLLPEVNHSLRLGKETGHGPLAPAITEQIARFLKAH